MRRGGSLLPFHPDGFVVELGLFFAHPFYKPGHFFMLVQALNGMIMLLQFRFGKNRLYFPLAGVPSAEGCRCWCCGAVAVHCLTNNKPEERIVSYTIMSAIITEYRSSSPLPGSNGTSASANPFVRIFPQRCYTATNKPTQFEARAPYSFSAMTPPRDIAEKN